MILRAAVFVFVVVGLFGGLLIRIREHFRIGAVLLALPLLSCASRPCPDMAYFGGATWRVFDVDLVDGVESRYAVDTIFRRVTRCTGKVRPYRNIRVYFANALWSKQADGNWRRKAGFHVGGGQMYVSRGMSVEDTRGTVAHEIAHYVTELDHPEIDPILVRCNIPLSAPLP